ncbi:MAG: GNAT family N-acetyltransferase [Paracoccaceae bacterium]|nr:GNAT family N-acetyltransferase [Paracoccaceae bacterium]
MSIDFNIPTLETERLLLRAMRLEDFEPMAGFFASARAEFVGGPVTPEMTWRQLAAELGHWALRGFGRWTLEEKDTGQAVGIVGLWYPLGFPEHELGWDLYDGATGKGYATEAGRAARDYAYSTLGWTTLISLIAEGNTGSEGVARRLGAAPEKPFVHERFGEAMIWRHPGPEAL